MRGEMAVHKQARGVLDPKLARGGLVDIEFLIHYLQLRDHVGFSPDLFGARDALIAAGLLPEGLAEAHRLMTRLLISSRLLAPDAAMPAPAAAQVLARNCRCDSPDDLLRAFAQARRCVAQAWQSVFAETLEIDDE